MNPNYPPKIPWNKELKGYTFTKKKVLDTNWNKIKDAINNGKTVTQIEAEFNLSRNTIYKYTKKKYPELVEVLKRNGVYHNLKHGGLLGFKELRKIKKEKCEICGSNKNLNAHHIKPSVYCSNYVIEGNHNIENIKILCNSCHQSEHYRIFLKELINKGEKNEIKTISI